MIALVGFRRFDCCQSTSLRALHFMRIDWTFALLLMISLAGFARPYALNSFQRKARLRALSLHIPRLSCRGSLRYASDQSILGIATTPPHQFRVMAVPSASSHTLHQVRPVRKEKSNQKQSGPERNSFLEHVRARDYDAAVAAFNTLQEAEIRELELFALLSVCHKAEHTAKAFEVVNQLRARNAPLHEGAYMSLMRCYSAAGQLDEAIEIVQEMIEKGMELRSRLFQPLLECLCHEGDLHRMLALVKYMIHLKVVITEEQLTPMLSILGNQKVRQSLQEDDGMRNTFNALLAEISHDLLSVYLSNMHHIVSASNGVSLDAVIEQGVLVETMEDISGDIVSASLSDGVVTAMNASYERGVTLARQRVLDKDLPGSSTDLLAAKLVPEKYTVLYENNTRMLLNSNLRQHKNLPARVVDISSHTCRCPNCDSEVTPLLMSEEDKEHVRNELFKLISKGRNLTNLHDFGDWLRAREEFEYIVDGANVAYNSQNFGKGMFSFKQVELVVDKLLARGKRVLVVLPAVYVASSGRIPNNVGSATTWREKSADDERIINRMRELDILYVAPKGSNDDWYWLYSTVYEGRRTPAYVVSNDYMRDHRATFAESRAFLRWRSSQIVYFSFSKAVEPLQLGNASYALPTVSLYRPGKFSREIQRSGDSNFWHIPAVDRGVWLCVNVAPPVCSVRKEDANPARGKAVRVEAVDAAAAAASPAAAELGGGDSVASSAALDAAG